MKVKVDALYWFPGRTLARVYQGGQEVAALEIVRDEGAVERDGYRASDHYDWEARFSITGGPGSSGRASAPFFPS